MSDDKEAAAADSTSQTILDDALHAADQTRATVKWIAGALASVPSLGIIGAFIRAPGDNGFDPQALAWGLGLAVVGAILALLAFAWVLSSTKVADADLADVKLSRIPGAAPLIEGPSDTAEKLVTRLQLLGTAVTGEENAVTAATVAARMSEVKASELDTQATAAEELAKGKGDDDPLSVAAKDARKRSNDAMARKVETAAQLAAQQVAADVYSQQFQRTSALRDKAILLRSADVVSGRFLWSLAALAPALILVGAGVYLLALAPKLDSTGSGDNAASVDVAGAVQVRLTTNDASQALLGCKAPTLDALRVATSADEATIITMRTPECEPKSLKFPISGFSGAMGSYEVLPAATIAP